MKLEFRVLERGQYLPSDAHRMVCLREDGWDDWGRYKTTYNVILFDDEGVQHELGLIKVGQRNMLEGRPSIPVRFEKLDDESFSLGQDPEYYLKLQELGEECSSQVLRALNDVAFDLEIFARVEQQDVVQNSLLRSVASNTVRVQYNRLANGWVELTSYSFHYVSSAEPKRGRNEFSLSFDVTPASRPPTNLHVVVGRNGVGKTRLLNKMAKLFINDDNAGDNLGRFQFSAGEPVANSFSHLVFVTFSAFDQTALEMVTPDDGGPLKTVSIGLMGRKEGESYTKQPNDLASDFSVALKACRKGGRRKRWQRAIDTLQSDPLFRDVDILSLIDEYDSPQEHREGGAHTKSRRDPEKVFKSLSSGHKIVLLTITKLVATVVEKTLVLIDEPEAHLHPPLLSSYMRALSNLLIDRNGVAIVATHSPVVLQEVPKSCVWNIRRNGSIVVAERPETETFGENVGVLTRELFRLEVEESGFLQMLRDVVADKPDFDAVYREFRGQLGGEALALVRALLINQDDKL